MTQLYNSESGNGVTLELLNMEMIEDFLLLELETCNVILRMQWLKILGDRKVLNK